MNLYRSAFKKHCSDRRVKIPESIFQSISDFCAGFKRKVGQLKQTGEMSVLEGKQPITFDGYIFLAQCAIESKNDFGSNNFAHIFLLLCWNLMARSISVGKIMYNHISWSGDALQITLPTHKGDQEGNHSYPRHVYANPLIPELCPILSLAIYVFCSTFNRTGARMVLFSESNNEGRFSKWLGKTCSNREEKIRELGLCINMIGTHSFRKGIATYVSSHPDGPSPVSIFLRAGWSLGNVQSRYIFAGSGGDQFVGRTACGLPLSDRTFSLLPPHFERSTGPLMSDDAWENVLPGYRNFPSPFISVLPYLVASLSYHYDWIKNNYDSKHPIFNTRIWTSGLIDQLRPKILNGCTTNEKSGMTASGIPATVAMANRIYAVESQLQDIQNILKENQTALIQIYQE